MAGVTRAAMRTTGWLLIAAGAVVLLYVVYSLLFTNVVTGRAQDDLAERWELSVGDVQGRIGQGGGQGRVRPVAAVDPGGALAVLQFSRPGSTHVPVHAEPLYVVEGVGVTDLQRGPGHYPGTALPGGAGNFAVAGHRTTYGAPFFNLDDLQPGDQILVTDRSGERFTYKVRRQEIVAPGETWVLGPDPLERRRRTLTLTTCHPRFSNRERLIVFAELAR